MMVNKKIISYFDIVSYVLLALTITLTPLALDSSLLNSFILPKQYVFIGLILINLLVQAIKVVISRKFEYRHSFLDIPLLVLLGIITFSALFSGNLNNSFLGRNESFVIHYVIILALFVFYTLVVNILKNEHYWRSLIDILLGIGGFTALLFIIKNIFKISLPFVGDVTNIISNSNTTFGIWLIVIITLAAGKLIKKELIGTQIAYYSAVLVICFVPLMVIGFKLLWWVLLVALLLLLLFGFSFIKQSRVGLLSVIFALLIIVVNFLVFGSPKSFQTQLPIEISLGSTPSWAVTQQSVFEGAKNFFIGNGPGTFAASFSKYRNLNFNYDSIAWSLRFSQPFNTVFALITELGVLFSIGFALLFLIVFGYIFKGGKNRRTNEFVLDSDIAEPKIQVNPFQKSILPPVNSDIYLLLIVWLVLLFAMFINFFGVTLWMLWAFFMGMIVSGLNFYRTDIIKKYEWEFEDIPQYNMAFSFSLIVIMAAVVMTGIMGSRFYLAESAYAKAISATTSKETDAYLVKTLKWRNNYDLYHIAQAKSYFEQAVVEAKKSTGKDEKQVASLVALAVNQARIATQLSPNTIGTWENLAVMYENAMVFVPEASSWAIKSLQTAIELEPSNAYLNWRLGRTYLITGNNEKAIESFKKATELKKDYIGAYVGLATANENSKKFDEAISIYEALASSGNRNEELLYNYGRLLYNRDKNNDKQNAAKLWIFIDEKNPNHSNSLYSLGLYYESTGELTKALGYYKRVEKINKNNKNLQLKIENLSKAVDRSSTIFIPQPVIIETDTEIESSTTTDS